MGSSFLIAIRWSLKKEQDSLSELAIGRYGFSLNAFAAAVAVDAHWGHITVSDPHSSETASNKSIVLKLIEVVVVVVAAVVLA